MAHPVEKERVSTSITRANPNHGKSFLGISFPKGISEESRCGADPVFSDSDNGSVFCSLQPYPLCHPWQADPDFPRKIRIVIGSRGTVVDTAARFELHKRETPVYGTNIIRQLIQTAIGKQLPIPPRPYGIGLCESIDASRAVLHQGVVPSGTFAQLIDILQVFDKDVTGGLNLDRAPLSLPLQSVALKGRLAKR